MKIYQISTLQALALGYTRPVVTVKELLEHGDIGLGTFEDVNGEMIVVDGQCFRATEDGTVWEAEPDIGVPFASVAKADFSPGFEARDIPDIEKMKELLTLKIEEDFGLNSMHIVRIDGAFNRVCARSESAYRSQHVDLKDILSQTQRDFMFEDISGTMVCIYYPDYMDGINAPGWHLHFMDAERKRGGHVLNFSIDEGKLSFCHANDFQIRLPDSPDVFAGLDLNRDWSADLKVAEAER